MAGLSDGLLPRRRELPLAYIRQGRLCSRDAPHYDGGPRSPNPDGRFIAMMRDFVTTYAAKNASTEDFQRIVEKHWGEPMDWYFNEWVYGTEIPHYDFSYDLKDAGNGKTLLHFTLKQSGVSDAFFMQVPFYVHYQQKVMRLGLIRIKGPTDFSSDVKLPFRPDKVMIDEYHTILSTEKE